MHALRVRVDVEKMQSWVQRQQLARAIISVKRSSGLSRRHLRDVQPRALPRLVYYGTNCQTHLLSDCARNCRVDDSVGKYVRRIVSW